MFGVVEQDIPKVVCAFGDVRGVSTPIAVFKWDRMYFIRRGSKNTHYQAHQETTRDIANLKGKVTKICNIQ